MANLTEVHATYDFGRWEQQKAGGSLKHSPQQMEFSGRQMKCPTLRGTFTGTRSEEQSPCLNTTYY